jgi:SOS-response transcriptional repressor LexA
VNLKGLIHRELGEGMTEKELASAIGVSLRTLENILADKFPEDPARWEKFARYFRIDVDFLRTGGLADSITILKRPSSSYHSAAGRIRKIPLLSWHQMEQMVRSTHLPGVLHAEAMLETTDVSGKRTIGLKVKDDSMEPLFTEGEIIFVNLDSKWKPGDYVIANCSGGHPETILLRQVKPIGSQYMLHPLNRKYEDLPLTKQDQVWGKVVRLRKNL